VNALRHAVVLFAAAWVAVSMPVAHGDEAAQAPVPATLVVRDAWARATPPDAGVAAVYLTIAGGTTSDTLRAAATSLAAMTQIHAVTESDGMARMREAADGVPIPARGKVRLAPGGLHLMLMGLARPLVAGERFDVTLEFERAGRRVTSVVVIAPGQDAPGGS
jgi:copper(I)-binding protein